MSEIVKKFTLKRTGKTSLSFTRDQIYPVYHSEMGKYTHYAFYMVDDCGKRRYFNTLNGQMDPEATDLASENWEVIRTSKEEKTMTKDFKGLKVGDKLTRDNDEWSWWIKGKEYKVYANATGFHPKCAFCIIDEEGARRWFNVDDDGKLTHADLQANFSWNKPDEKTPSLTDGMILVCTKENKDYAMFTEGNEYPVNTDYDEPCIFSDGNTAWFEREINVLKGYGITFMVKEVEVEPETPPHTITITGHDWVDLEKNLRDAYRKVKLLSKASEKFDESTAELAQRVLEYKKIGGQ